MGKRKRQRQDEGNHFTTAESLIGQTFFVDHPPAEEDGEAPRGGYGSQVLPVAELEGDWEGDPGDGSEYLSLVRSVRTF